MPFIPAAQAPNFNIPGSDFTGLAAPSRGSAETAVWRLRVAPGSAGKRHQLTREEIVVGLAGSAVANVGADRYPVGPGDTVVVPAFTDFSLDNEGDAPFEALVAFPVGGEALLPEDGQQFTPPWAR